MEADIDFIKKLIETELRSNLSVLIDPKKKDSFCSARVQTWVKLVTERIIYHLPNKNTNYI